jgi:hypothetical protein
MVKYDIEVANDAIMRINCYRTGHNHCSGPCERVTDNQTRRPGTALARSKLAPTTQEF